MSSKPSRYGAQKQTRVLSQNRAATATRVQNASSPVSDAVQVADPNAANFYDKSVADVAPVFSTKSLRAAEAAQLPRSMPMRETKASRALKHWVEEVDKNGERIRTQEDVAREVSRRVKRETEINQSTVSAWCAARSKPRGDVMVALFEIAGVPLPWWNEYVDSASTGTDG